MHLRFSWFLMAMTMVSASPSPNRESALGQAIRPRGEEYTQCIENYLQQGIDKGASEVPQARACLDNFAAQIRDCLQENTDKESEERSDSMTACHKTEAENVKHCMTSKGISEDDQTKVVAYLNDARQQEADCNELP
ncbi:hypothetical protein BJX96DRAFT_144808 [Aspergillus floccosus]